MKTTLQLLQDGKRLLIEKGWTQNAFALDANGRNVPSWKSEATCYCGLGAVRAAARAGLFDLDPTCWKAEQALSNAAGEEFDWDFPTFNDYYGRTKEEVLAKFDEAIAAEEARAAA